MVDVGDCDDQLRRKVPRPGRQAIEWNRMGFGGSRISLSVPPEKAAKGDLSGLAKVSARLAAGSVLA